jgi:hypothetical protein
MGMAGFEISIDWPLGVGAANMEIKSPAREYRHVISLEPLGLFVVNLWAHASCYWLVFACFLSAILGRHVCFL